MRLLRRRPRRRTPAREPRTVRALLDFGASGARAAVARVTPDHVEILGMAEVTGRSGMARPGHVMRRDRIATLAERALSAAEWSTARDGDLPFIADEAVVGLTGPMLEAHPAAQHLRRPDPAAPVFEDELLTALARAQASNLHALAEQLRRSPIRRSLVGSQLVGAASVRADTLQAERLPEALRGVPGMSGEFLSVAICNLTWPTKGLEVLGRVLDDLELRLLSAAPLARAVAAALPLPDAVLIDLGRDHTEVALAEGGALSGLVSLPSGGQSFTDALTRYLRLSEKHAELVKQRVAREGAPEGSPVARVLNRAIARWVAGLEEVLQQLAGEAPLPPRIYLYGGGSGLTELATQLRSHAWRSGLSFERPPSVERLLPHHLRGLYDPRGLFHSPAHVGLAALATWAGHTPSPLQRHLTTVSQRLATTLKLA